MLNTLYNMQKLISFTILVLLLQACSPYKVTQEYDKNTDFNRFKTFSFSPWDSENSRLVNRFDQERLISAIANELTKKGYTQVSGKGDLIVDIFVIFDQKQGTTAYTSHYASPYWGGYGFYGYGYGYFPGYGSTVVETYNYVQGTIIINLFDRMGKLLVWQGTGIGTVSTSHQERKTNIPKIIEQIFFKFPKKRKKS
jgi:hypothetical protein